MIGTGDFSRRAMLALGWAGLTAAASPRPVSRFLVFDIWRGSHRIGRHEVAISGDADDSVTKIDAAIAVAIGPITVFRYHHQATEIWRQGRFAELTSHTLTNGHRDEVRAIATPQGVNIESLGGNHILSVAAAPLTHWNRLALEGSMFNPQTGAPLRERVVRQENQMLSLSPGRTLATTRYSLTGDAEVVDWYDTANIWIALRARASDNSVIEYRRANL